MRTRAQVWKLVAELPAVVAGIALMTVPTGLLPARWAGAALLAWFVLAAAAGTRNGERVLARLVLRGRRPTPAEQAALAGPVSRLCAQGLGPPAVDLLVVDRPGWAEGFGRRTLLVSNQLVTGLRQQRHSEDEATALLVSAAGFGYSGFTRWDAPFLLLSLPFLPVRILAAAVGQATRGLPLVRFAWRIRGLPIAAGAWQCVTVHHSPQLAVVTLVFGVLTYLLPIVARRAQRELQLAADDFAAETGHLSGLTRFLARFPDDGFAIERLHRVSPPPVRLSVVR